MICRRLWTAVPFAGLLLFVPGCGDDTSGPGSSTLDQPTAQQAGQAIADEVQNLTGAFIFQGFEDVPVNKAASLLAASGVASARFPDAQAWRRALAGLACANPTKFADADFDGIPDDVTVSFDLPGCTVTGDGITTTLSGSFRLTDPGEAMGFNITYTNITLRIDSQDGGFLETRFNGTQGVSATPTLAGLNNNVTARFLAGGPTGNALNGGQTIDVTFSENWQAGFDVAAEQVFDPTQPLPDGELSVSGSSTLTSGTDSFSFALTTPVALVHDAQCEVEPTIESGIVRAAVAGNGGAAFIRITYQGCGQDPLVEALGLPAN